MKKDAARAGYSATPLPRKLGIKEGQRIVVLNEPQGYLAKTLAPLPAGVRVEGAVAPGSRFVQVFVTSREWLAGEMPGLVEALAQDGMLWVSWPKRSSKVATDLSENAVRDIALSFELVDVKVCAIDETWSGLKLVRRLRDRK